MVAANNPLIIKPHPGPQTAFLSSRADIAIYGGAAGGGKSWSLLAMPLMHVGYPRFNAAIFRRESKQITNAGSLWDEATEIYTPFQARPQLNTLTWRFRSGAKIQFNHLQHETDKLNHQGAAYAYIGFDELTHFTASQFFYFPSRNRSLCGVRPYMRATCNPDRSSWVRKTIDWWIGPDGFPIPERSGVLRWFVRDNGENIIYGDSREELLNAFPKSKPKTLTFIPAMLSDNPTLTEKDPDYEANLAALGYVDRMRLLYGNWNITSTEGAEWASHPEYFESHIKTELWPDRVDYSVMWVDPSKGKTDKADPSAIVFVGVRDGRFFVQADIRIRSADDIVVDMIRMYQRLQPMCVGVESNGFQELLSPLIDHACKFLGIPPLPIRCMDNTTNKKVRIRRLEPYLKKQQIKIYQLAGTPEELFSQLINFGIPTCHDDGPDALESAIRLMSYVAAEVMSGVEERWQT